MYSISAINHWLYEHTTTDALLAHVLTGYRNGAQGVAYTQMEVLAAAPAGCRAFIIHVGHMQSGHYKAWVESAGEWYECDSLTCTSTLRRVKRLTPDDWTTITRQGGTFYCLIARDAHAFNHTLTPPTTAQLLPTNMANHNWVDGTLLEVSQTVIRRIQRRMPSAAGDGGREGPPTQPEKLNRGRAKMPPSYANKPKPDIVNQQTPQKPRSPERHSTIHRRAQPGQGSKPALPRMQPAATGRAKATKAPASQPATSKNQKKQQGQRLMTDFLSTDTAVEQKKTQPTAHPTGAPRYKDLQSTGPGTGTADIAKLSVMTLNVQGLSTSEMHVADIAAGKFGPAPDVMVLTETKAKSAWIQRTWLQLLRKSYHVYQSTVASSDNCRAGVLMAVNKRITELGAVRQQALPAAAQGYLLHVVVEAPESNPLHVVGVYCPPQQAQQELRRHIYAECEQILADNPSTHNTVVLAGDFNATIQNCDRYRNADRCEAADNMHREFLSKAKLAPLDPPKQGTPRRHTYRRYTSSTPCSRIDDIYINLGPADVPSRQTDIVITDMTGVCTDHDMLTAGIPYHLLRMQPPLEPLPPTDTSAKKLKTPISKMESIALKSALLTSQQIDYMSIAQQTSEYVVNDVLPHWERIEGHNADRPQPLLTLGAKPARAVVDELGATLTGLLMKSLEIATQTCTTTPLHPQGPTHYYPRGVARKKWKIITEKREVARRLRNMAAEDNAESTKMDRKHADKAPAGNPHRKVAENVAHCQQQHPELTQTGALLHMHKDLNRQLASINKEHAKLSEQAEIRKTRQQLDERQKTGNKIATGKAAWAPKSALRVLDTGAGTTSDPTRIMQLIETYYQDKLCVPGGGIKTGHYLPEEVARDYPWKSDPAHRMYQNLLPGSETPHREWLHDAIDDEVAFDTCLRSLAKGKAPGPDRVPNEILQALPDTGKQTIHNLVRIMWATGMTPTGWKESSTILMFKNKGTALQLPYYRRIGLENTLYKLWTRMVTYAMADRAERSHMISSSQAGFRSKRTCGHQIEMLIMALEDAHLTKQDIYLLQADMTEAFDTISHDKLLMILYDLGFPTDAIEVVKDLYSGASTKIQTPHGPTSAIPFDRGTIQGDSLSPFLFVTYLEPLLRWLKAGRQGYMAGVLKDKGSEVQTKYQISDITYADDVNILTGGPDGLPNLKKQAAKLSAYATWGHLTVSNTKTTVTGALHGSVPKQPYDERRLRTQLTNTIKIQEKPITYHSPKSPFRHLGVELSMDLNYKHHFKATLEKLRKQVKHLHWSYASTRQKQRIIETCLRPAVSYAFAAAPYSLSELKALDSQLTKATKQAYRLSTSLATVVTHQDKKLGGLGCHSLEVEYHQICNQNLIRALNDEGPRGVLTRALLAVQKSGADLLSTEHMPCLQRYSLRIRQLLALKRCNLSLMHGGTHEDTMQDMNGLAQALSAKLPDTTVWDNRVVQDIHTLHAAGITAVEDMLTIDKTHVLPASSTRHLIGKRHVRTRQLCAWNRLTHMLHTGKPKAAGPTLSSDLRGEQRKLHPSVYNSLKCAWSVEHANHSKNILHILSDIPAQHEGRARAAADTMLSHWERMLANNPKDKTANIRTQQDGSQHTQIKYSRDTGYAQYLTATEKLVKNPNYRNNPRFIQKMHELYTMYSHTDDVILEVVGLSTATKHAGKGKKFHRVGESCVQAVVKWAPSIQPAWLASVAQYLRYKIKHAPESLHNEEMCNSEIHRPCEHCKERVSADAGDVLTCTVCSRVYHQACIPRMSSRKRGRVDNEDTEPAYTCKECRDKQQSTPNLPEDLKMVKLEWQEAPEPLSKVDELGVPAARQQLRQLLDQREDSKPYDARHTQHIQRNQHGPWATANGKGDNEDTAPLNAAALPADRLYDITIGQQCRKQLVIHPDPINPHADVHPTGRYEVSVRPITQYQRDPSAGYASGEHVEQVMACIYQPDGKCTHMTRPEVAAHLHQRYLYMQEQHPEVMKRLEAGTFAEELYKLMCRYNEGTVCSTKQGRYTIEMKHQRAMPSAVRAALQQIAGCDKERLASPLSVHPGTTAYWSIHKQDQVFGARYDAYKVQWMGASIASPDFTEEQANKAMVWAIQSAIQTEQPTLTMLLIPTYTKSGDSTAHMKWVKNYPGCCKHLMTLPKSLVKLEPSPTARHQPAEHLKWSTQLIAVGNTAGFAKYLPYWKESAEGLTWRQAFKEAIQTSLEPSASNTGSSPSHASELRLNDEGAAWWTSPPSPTTMQPRTDCTKLVPTPGFKKRPQDTKQRPRSRDLASLMSQDPRALGALSRAVRAATRAMALAVTPAAPLRFNWRDFIYTDGSVLANRQDVSPGIGAGVYIPDNLRLKRHEAAIAVSCFQDSDDQQPACVNTINRAELAAIDVALKEAMQQTDSPPEIHIATDSLASIYQVRRANTRPQDMKEHRHLNIIENIARAISSSTSIVHLWKVRSHIGIVGNEIADETAVAVSNGQVPDEDLSSYDTTSNNRDRMYWIYQAKPKTQQSQDNNGDPQGPQATKKQEQEPTYLPMANMADALKAHIHKLRKMGSANRDTVYHQAWESIDKAIDHNHSHMFVTSSTCTGYQRKLVMQYRYGLLPTNKLMHRYKKSTTANCPLCGMPDGGHHSVSGCRHLGKALTLRHNEAGAAIVEAIHAGTRSGYLVAADVGVNKRRRMQGLPELNIHKGLPSQAVPSTVPARVKRHLMTHSIPDALLYHYDRKKRQRRYVVVEIKYCRDTDPAGQLSNAAQQHHSLVQTLRLYDPTASIKQCNLMLGVGGAIYQKTAEHLKEDLGVDGPPLHRLLDKLHFIAVKHLEQVWRYRRAKLNGKQGNKRAATGTRKRAANGGQGAPVHRTTHKKK
jgi:exonuclease III/ribonuclease HI